MPHPDRLGKTIKDVFIERLHKVAVAVANKMARVIWAVWSRNVPYELMPKAS